MNTPKIEPWDTPAVPMARVDSRGFLDTGPQDKLEIELAERSKTPVVVDLRNEASIPSSGGNNYTNYHLRPRSARRNIASDPNNPNVDPEMESWGEFLQSTTFHGVRFIFDGKSWSRKLLWVTCVTISIALFVVQVATRTNDFLQYKSNVEIRVRYNKSLQFPSVTICNQNNFRMTEIHKRNMTNLIRNVHYLTGYSNKGMVHVNETLPEFLNRTSHQIEDMIARCEWGVRPCNASDWQTVFTEYGVCFQFNHDIDAIKETSTPGSPYGLKLVLNIEQYEYEAGPHNDVGVKVLLHHQSEVPLVGFYGFAIPPGKQTLVSVSHTQSAALIPPHGDCTDGAIPRPACLLQCMQDKIEDACKCRLPHMTVNSSDVPICSIAANFDCVKRENDNRAKDECSNCLVPCLESRFSSDLSYSDLSTNNFERLWKDDRRRESSLGKRYVDSRELAQRLTPRLQLQDRKLFSDPGVLKKEELLRGALLSTRNILTLNELDTTPTFRGSWKDAYKDFVTIKDRYKSAADSINKTAVTQMYDKIHSLDTKQWGRPTEAVLLERYEYLIQLLNLNNEAEVQKASYSHSVNTSSDVKQLEQFLNECSRVYDCSNASQVTVPPQCGSLVSLDLAYSVAGLSSSFNGPVPDANDIALPAVYAEFVAQIFNGTVQHDAIRQSTAYTKCLDGLHDLSYIIGMHLQRDTQINMMRDFAGMYMFPNCRRWVLLEDIINWYRQLEEFYSLNRGGEYRFACMSIIEQIHDAIDDEDDDVENMISEILREYETDGYPKMSGILKSNDEILDLLDSYSQPLFDPYYDFLNESITKNSLNEYICDPTYTRTNNFVHQRLRQYENLYQDFNNPLRNLKGGLTRFFKWAFTTVSLPILPYTMLEQSAVLQSAQYYLNNDTYDQASSLFKDAIAELNKTYMEYLDDPTTGIHGVVDVFLAEHERQVQWAEGYMVQQHEYLVGVMDNAKKHLAEFTESNELDANYYLSNYIHLDIFYKDLQYTKVVQQPQFGSISLLSEVGGFLGLLLGASLLTVCEILDYLIRLAVYRCTAGKENKVNRESHFAGQHGQPHK